MKRFLIIFVALVVLPASLPLDASAARRWRICVNNDNGNIVIKRRCKNSETEIPTSSDLGAFSVGVNGIAGVDGVKGPTGPQGPQGDRGATGPSGADGSDGGAGPQGAQGPQGPIGDQGQQGAQGIPGVAGNDALPMNVSKTEDSDTTTTEILALGVQTLLINCPLGESVVGGYCYTDNDAMEVTGSYPQNTTTWSCVFSNLSGSTIPDGTSVTRTGGALCADVTS